MSKPVTWVIVLAGIAVVLPLLALAFFYVALNGGVYGTILNMKPRPNPDSPGINRDRTKLEADLDAAFQRVVANSDLAYYETSKDDACYDGVNNFKIHDGYAHRCTLRVTRFYGFDGDFRQKMIDFEKGIIATGWHFELGNGDGRYTHPSDSMESYMLVYYDTRPYGTVDHVAGPLGYSKDAFDLRIKWAERNTTDRHSLQYLQSATDNMSRYYKQQSLQDVDDLFRRVTRDHRYVLAIAIEGHYFEN